MDNITHSLIGGLIGGHVASAKKLPAVPLVIASLLGNNFPDADIIYASHFSEPFGYLLHHRGHTHTLLGILLCGLIAWALIVGGYRVFRRPLDRSTSRMVGVLVLLGGAVHLCLDWLNTYGVHPFWPFSNQWYYGDTIFIIEPTLWISLGFAAVTLARSKLTKALCSLPVLLAVGLILGTGKVPPLILAVLVTALSTVWLLSRKRTSEQQSRNWIYAAVSVLMLFSLGRIAAQYQLQSIARPAHTDPPSTSTPALLSFVIPSPVNPLCWSYLQMDLEENVVAYRRGHLQLFGSLISIDCARYSLNESPNQGTLGDPFRTTLLSEFTALTKNCRWNAFRQFARVPGVEKCADGGLCTADYRFTRLRRNNFTSLPLSGPCPDFLPPWQPPITFPWDR